MPIGTRPQARNRFCGPAALACGAALSLQGATVLKAKDLPRHFAEETHLGVVVRIDAYLPPEANPARVFRSALDRVASLARSLSDYREDSELRVVENTAWQEPIPVSIDFYRVLSEALLIAHESDGAFDPTLGSVTRLVRRAQNAGPLELARAWDRTGWRQVALDGEGRTVFLRKRGIQFDLGGIAKGYIADQALESLRQAGVSRALVAVAGDIVAGAPPPGKEGWSVAVDAAGARGTVERKLALRNQAVSTSGSRERNYASNGKRCSHIVTRWSATCAETGPAVSVVAPTGLEADGLATALLALGRERSGKLLASHPEARAYWFQVTDQMAEAPVESPAPR